MFYQRKNGRLAAAIEFIEKVAIWIDLKDKTIIADREFIAAMELVMIIFLHSKS